MLVLNNETASVENSLWIPQYERVAISPLPLRTHTGRHRVRAMRIMQGY